VVIRGLLTDEEWELLAPFVAKAGPQGGRPPQNHRRVLDAIFWIDRTGTPWRDLPEALGNWNSVHKQFRRWAVSGVWDVVLQALADGGGDAELQMIDSTISRAHHCAAGEKGGFKARRLAVRAAGSRPRSTCAPMLPACRSPSF
jgi:transposase